MNIFRRLRILEMRTEEMRYSGQWFSNPHELLNWLRGSIRDIAKQVYQEEERNRLAREARRMEEAEQILEAAKVQQQHNMFRAVNALNPENV